MRLLVALGLLVGAVAACSSQPAASCYPGDSVACTCSGGEQGLEKCGTDGQYGECACASGGTGGAGGATTSSTTGTTTSSGGTGGATSTSTSSAGGGDAGLVDGGLLPFMSPCTDNTQCESGLCWMFPTKGGHCDIMCTTDADCPSPSPGCNPQGVCRAP